MHELSIATEIADSVRRSLEGKNIVRLEMVRLEIGELTMLGKDQLRFAWGILTGDGPLKGSKLVMVRKPAIIECLKCGFRGAAGHPASKVDHLSVPLIDCPKCGGDVRVVGGRECIIRSIRAVMEDGRGKKKRRRR